MARITVEDCLTKETNRFALVHLASQRTKQLLGGGKTAIADTRGNKAVVTALREIAEGKVQFMSEEDMRLAKERAAREAEVQAVQVQLTPEMAAREALDDLFRKPDGNGTSAAAAEHDEDEAEGDDEDFDDEDLGDEGDEGDEDDEGDDEDSGGDEEEE